MIVVSNSSPLISLAKIDAFDLLQKFFGELSIPVEVYDEVVGAGVGLAGGANVSESPWIAVHRICNTEALEEIRSRRPSLGLGELSAILLAREMAADLIILDDLDARKFAQKLGMKVNGSVGVLEACYRRGHLTDLRRAYRRMLEAGAYLDRGLLNRTLASLNLAPL